MSSVRIRLGVPLELHVNPTTPHEGRDNVVTALVIALRAVASGEIALSRSSVDELGALLDELLASADDQKSGAS